MVRSRLVYLVLAVGVVCSIGIHTWLPDLVSYDVAEKCILYVTPIPSALLLLFWRNYRGSKFYEKLNGLQTNRFNKLKTLIHKRLIICFSVSIGSSAAALFFNFLTKIYFEAEPNLLPTVYLTSTSLTLIVNFYLAIAVLFWIFELADFSDRLDEKASTTHRINDALKRIDLTESH